MQCDMASVYTRSLKHITATWTRDKQRYDVYERE